MTALGLGNHDHPTTTPYLPGRPPVPLSSQTSLGLALVAVTQARGTHRMALSGGGSGLVVPTMPKATNGPRDIPGVSLPPPALTPSFVESLDAARRPSPGLAPGPAPGLAPALAPVPLGHTSSGGIARHAKKVRCPRC